MIESPRTAARALTLAQHISHQQRELRSTGEFSAVLSQISLAGKIISESLSQAGLFSRIAQGSFAGMQAEAERVDAIAIETFVRIFTNSPFVSTLLLAEEIDAECPMH